MVASSPACTRTNTCSHTGLTPSTGCSKRAGSGFDECLQAAQVAAPDGLHHHVAADDLAELAAEPPGEAELLGPGKARAASEVDGGEGEPSGAGDEAGVAHAHGHAGLPLGDLHPVDQLDR